MTLTRAACVGGMFYVILLALVFFWGNQRLAFAEVTSVFSKFNERVGQPLPEVPPLPELPETSPDIDNLVEEELCKIYTRLNEAGEPIPQFETEGCEGSGNPPPPPPPPPPGGGDGGTENTLARCTDGVDNDGDSKIDLEDPDCSSFRPTLTVTLVVVNDNGGTNSTSSYSLSVNKSSPGSSESIGLSSGVATVLSGAGTWTLEGAQKAGYSAIYSGDCNAAGEVTLSAGQTKSCTITSNDVAPGAPACSDGIDNDGDGAIDSADSGCTDPSDTDESNPTGGGGNPPSGGGGGGGSGGAIASQSTGAVLGASTTPPAVAAGESCDQYLTAFIRSGRANDTEQVKRLQYVLREFEGVMSVEVNGVYDAITLAAVHAFQTKYASEILTPWGISESTGYVYLTTRKKVNEIYCQNTKLFPLTQEEEQRIERARAGLPQTSDTASTQTSAGTAQTASAAEVTQAQNSSEGTGASSTSQGAWWDSVSNFLRGIFRTGR